MYITSPVRPATQVNADGVATIAGDRYHTWAEFAARVARLAGALRQLGVGDGDRVAMLAWNSDRYLEYYFAVPWAGGIIVPLNPRWTDSIGSWLLSRGERSYLRQDGGLIAGREYDDFETGFWSALQMAHPSTKALVSFTRAGFNADTTEAIIGIHVQNADDQRRGETILVKREGDTWKVLRRHLDREAITGRFSGGVCVPDLPAQAPSREELAALSGDYDFTLVSSAVDNRIIKWRMRFVPDTLLLSYIAKDTAMARRVLSGGPILPAFQVIDPVTGSRLINREPGTYLSAGKASFQNAAYMMQFDGFGYILKIRGSSPGMLFGQWEHYSFGIPIGKDGRAVPEPAGHFCAAKRIVPDRDE